jgi:hypothetical protein
LKRICTLRLVTSPCFRPSFVLLRTLEHPPWSSHHRDPAGFAAPFSSKPRKPRRLQSGTHFCVYKTADSTHSLTAAARRELSEQVGTHTLKTASRLLMQVYLDPQVGASGASLNPPANENGLRGTRSPTASVAENEADVQVFRGAARKPKSTPRGQRMRGFEPQLESVRSSSQSSGSEENGSRGLGGVSFNQDVMLDDALRVLARYWDRIDGSKALRLLPMNVDLQRLIPFLGPLLRRISEGKRNAAVVKSLRRSENLQVGCWPSLPSLFFLAYFLVNSDSGWRSVLFFGVGGMWNVRLYERILQRQRLAHRIELDSFLCFPIQNHMNLGLGGSPCHLSPADWGIEAVCMLLMTQCLGSKLLGVHEPIMLPPRGKEHSDEAKTNVT